MRTIAVLAYTFGFLLGLYCGLHSDAKPCARSSVIACDTDTDCVRKNGAVP